jgi:acyl-CoA reductase-like NAD-dependent aldehyde dehydrogenase
MVPRVKRAQMEYATFPQEKVDAIFRKVAIVANVVKIDIAKMAVAETGAKYPITDYALTPDMAICDPELVMGMPSSTSWQRMR